ncbi:MAG: type I-F CRISPR-associated protein Csy3 [Gammaproteobacteria bacterium]|jgi:CRISPR-associated protein Csy3|nr:type I-F CRISPR-associated protein Csy3 [Gammaproteobacteria bacterium]
MAKKKSAIPSVLAFEKKLVPSDAQMFATSWKSRDEEAQELRLQVKSVRGTISNRLSVAQEKDPAKIDAEVEKPNLQTVDHCALPSDKDTLKLRFTLKILSNVQEPSACNHKEFYQGYRNIAEEYIERTRFTELAKRYATNLANGRFLWRNRVGAEAVEVVVTYLVEGESQQQWRFDAKEIGLHDYDHQETNELAEVIAESLSGSREFALLDIVTYSQLGEGQEVYPSEELVTEKGDKRLYETDGIAAMHSQKVGNAIRTIDDWYSEEAERPIAVEAYGAVTNLGTAYRKPVLKNDFYTLFDRFALGESLAENEEHYVMAMLVRGGVFGQSSK